MDTASLLNLGLNILRLGDTLATTRLNAAYKNPESSPWQGGTVRGRLEEKGWGAAVGFPGIVLGAASSTEVDGWLLTATALADHWAELDEFEGDEYERLLTDVVLDDGTEVKAWIYGLRA